MLRTDTKIIKNLFVMLAVLGLAGCQAADGTSQAPDTALVKSLMTGLGAVDPNEKPIEYKPRAPLAMPSKMDSLPAPDTAVAANEKTNWPTKEVNKEFEQLKKVYATSGTGSDKLTPEQMRGFTIKGTSPKQDTALSRRQAELGTGELMTREELANGHRQVSADTTINVEQRLERKYLTEPPAAYNAPAANAPVPTIVNVKTERKRDISEGSALLDMRCLEETGGECRRD